MLRSPVLALSLALLAGAAPVPHAHAEEAPAAAAAPDRTPTVTVVKAARREVVDSVIVTGTLVPREEIQVSADVDGLKIEDIRVEEGDRVEAGAVLAKLAVDMIDVLIAQNASQYARAEAAIAQAKSQIAEARANEVWASAQHARSLTLGEKGVISKDTVEQRLSAADAAQARLAAAEQALIAAEADKTLNAAQRRELELRRDKTEVKAPKAGLVLERTARLGAIVSSQSGPLFRLAEDGLIELEAEVSETVLARLAQGQQVSVTPAGMTAPIAGTIRLVSPEVNATTRLGHMRVALPADAPVRAGAFARATVELATSSGIAVPVSAVLTENGAPSVQVVTDGVITVRPVTTGLSGGGLVEIVEGLAEGDAVVARAGTFLGAGDKVKPVEAASEGAKG